MALFPLLSVATYCIKVEVFEANEDPDVEPEISFNIVGSSELSIGTGSVQDISTGIDWMSTNFVIVSGHDPSKSGGILSLKKGWLEVIFKNSITLA